MKKITILLGAILMLCISCKKEEVKPATDPAFRLTNNDSKTWIVTKVTVNEKETKEFACAINTTFQFFSNGKLVINQTCTGKTVEETYSLKTDSLFLEDAGYKMPEFTDKKLVIQSLSYVKTIITVNGVTTETEDKERPLLFEMTLEAK